MRRTPLFWFCLCRCMQVQFFHPRCQPSDFQTCAAAAYSSVFSRKDNGNIRMSWSHAFNPTLNLDWPQDQKSGVKFPM